MLNRFVSYFTLKLGHFVQDFDAQQTERTIVRNRAKFLEFLALARKFDLCLKNFTMMMPQEPSDIKARIPRIIMVTISDCVIICRTGTVLFKTTSKKILQNYTYYIIIQKSTIESGIPCV